VAAGTVGISRTVVAAIAHELAQMGDRGALGVLAGDAMVVPGRAADAAFERAATALRDPTVALSVARRLAIGSLGEIDYVLCTSDSLRVGLGRLARFYRVATERVSLAIEESGDQASLVFRATTTEAYSRHWRELAVGIIARRVRQTLGREVRFRGIDFAHAAPPRVEPYVAFFGLAPRFSADADRIVFARALLDEPLRTAARALGDLLEAKMREAEPPEAAQGALLARVRRTVAAQIDARDLTLATTAARLATSKRTLQRDLARAGTSHQAVVDDVRRALALALLESNRMTTVEISERLGFKDPRAFFRAFRRWTGTSPAALRAGGARQSDGPNAPDGSIVRARGGV
jgi:AraC-like DNA-binding protein